ncbi:MAG: DUF4157 domain-containing protein [Panacibacter sp.]
MKISIKEQSLLARITAITLREKKVAIVTCNVIHLWNAEKDEFLQNKKWLQHELVHVLQYREHGCFRFVMLYLWESLKKGYYGNKFEKEARLYENDSVLSAYVKVI